MVGHFRVIWSLETVGSDMPKLKYLNGAVSVLKWTVLYPIDEQNSKLKKISYFVWALFFVSSFVTTVIQCVMFLVVNDFDMLQESMMIMNSALYITLFINFFLFYSNSDKLKNLISNINEFFLDKTDNGVDDISMSKIAKICNFMSYYWTFSVISSGFFTGLLPLLMGDRSIMPIPGWFPYDYTQTPYYELSYLWQMLCQINLGMIYGASDMIYPNFTIIIGRQFEILANNFENCFNRALLKFGVDRDVVMDFGADLKIQSLRTIMEKYRNIFEIMDDPEFYKTCHKYLGKNIQHHQMLIGMCNNMNELMSPYLFIKQSVISFNTILIVFTLITSQDNTLLVGLACYAFFGSTELFIYNYGGQILIQKSDILWSVYKCPWYLCGLKFQKTFLFVQMRIQENICTKAGGFFMMSAATFVSFIRGIFSYAAVLKEVA